MCITQDALKAILVAVPHYPMPPISRTPPKKVLGPWTEQDSEQEEAEYEPNSKRESISCFFIQQLQILLLKSGVLR